MNNDAIKVFHLVYDFAMKNLATLGAPGSSPLEVGRTIIGSKDFILSHLPTETTSTGTGK